MSIRTVDVTRSGRHAGEVKRYHCWPNMRPQSIAAHSWHVWRIYREIWGQPPADVTDHLLLHDTGELNSGDVAHHVKVALPELKALMDAAEADGRALLGFDLPLISDREKLRVKACDLLEMAEYATEEQLAGNRLMEPVTRNIEWALHIHLKKVDADDRHKIVAHVRRINDRSARCGVPTLVLDGEDRR